MEKRKHAGPVNRKYKVRYNSNSNTVDIINLKEGHLRTFSPINFVYGQCQFNEATDRYPNYVHQELWNQHDKRTT